MIDELRRLTKNMPRTRKVMSFVYAIAFEPFISGYVAYMLKYLLLFYPKEKALLKKKGFVNIHPYQTKMWRRGNELDGAHRRYFKAKYDNKMVFVKVAFNDATIDNEIYMSEVLSLISESRIPLPVVSSSCFQDNKKMLAIEFFDGLRPFSMPASEKIFEGYCYEFYCLLENLDKHRIVHADIHPKNLMIDSDNHIHLLDFGISSVAGKPNHVDYNARPGTWYAEEGEYRIYDDAYSFVKMCNKLKMPDNYINKYYKEIEKRIGANVLKIHIKRKDVS